MNEVHDAVVGTLIGDRYRVESVLGRGGTATVYRAVDEMLGRTVALKIIGMGVGDTPELSRGATEMELLASLSHPAIVTLFDALTLEGGQTCLIMELVDGSDLGARLSLGPLPVSDIARMCLDLAEALHVAHARGVVHRDIKPANVLLAPSPYPTLEFTAKLADFGIAHLLDSARVTATGTMVGTAAYLSPEQAVGKPPGSPADIYSLGLVVLESFTRERAFTGSLMESVAARLSRDPYIPDSVPAGWRDLLARMTARDPEARPTAIDVALAAQQLLSTADVSPEQEAIRLAAAATVLDESADDATVAAAYDTVAPTRVFTTHAPAADSPTAATEHIVGSRAPAAPVAANNPPRSGLAAAVRKPFVLLIAGLAVLALVVAAIGISTIIRPASEAAEPTAPATSTSTAEPRLLELPAPLSEHMDELLEEVSE